MTKKAVNPGDPQYWVDLKARFLAERISALTIAQIDAFEVAVKRIKPGMVYESYVADVASEARSHYAALIEAVGRPDAFNEQVRYEFIRTCSERIGMPEINSTLEEIRVEAASAVKDAYDHLYGM